MWGEGRACALNTHGHSILRKCGAELLSLDDMFESVTRANTHYWAGFNLVAQALRSTDQDALANVVDGVAYYGGATSSPTGVVSNLLQSVRIPVTELGVMITQKAFPYSPPGIIVTSNPVKMAQFSYQLVAGCVSDLLPLFVRIARNSNDHDAANSIITLFVNRVFQARDAYYESVTQGVLQGCSGLALMIGYDNPWGTLVRRQCEAVPISLIGMYDLVLALIVYVPVAKCMCVDAAAGGEFRQNAIDKCYYIVPTHMKPRSVFTPPFQKRAF